MQSWDEIKAAGAEAPAGPRQPPAGLRQLLGLGMRDPAAAEHPHSGRQQHRAPAGADNP